MKRDIIISLALLSLFLILSDCLQHFGKILEARDTVRIVEPGSRSFEQVEEFMCAQWWSAGKEVAAMLALGVVILLVIRLQPPNKSLRATANAAIGRAAP